MDPKTKKLLMIAGGSTVAVVGTIWLVNRINAPKPKPKAKLTIDVTVRESGETLVSFGQRIGGIEYSVGLPEGIPAPSGGTTNASVANSVLAVLQARGAKPPTRINMDDAHGLAPRALVETLAMTLTDAGFKLAWVE